MSFIDEEEDDDLGPFTLEDEPLEDDADPESDIYGDENDEAD